MLKMALTNRLSSYDQRGPASVTRLPAIVQFESGSAGNAGPYWRHRPLAVVDFGLVAVIPQNSASIKCRFI